MPEIDEAGCEGTIPMSMYAPGLRRRFATEAELLGGYGFGDDDDAHLIGVVVEETGDQLGLLLDIYRRGNPEATFEDAKTEVLAVTRLPSNVELDAARAEIEDRHSRWNRHDSLLGALLFATIMGGIGAVIIAVMIGLAMLFGRNIATVNLIFMPLACAVGTFLWVLLSSAGFDIVLKFVDRRRK